MLAWCIFHDRHLLRPVDGDDPSAWTGMFSSCRIHCLPTVQKCQCWVREEVATFGTQMNGGQQVTNQLSAFYFSTNQITASIYSPRLAIFQQKS
mmetsp:Transcript_36691/g.79197  ORF Transcript_36691/g.79197 Transcript_36691/m.79197 type:complete len:94 (-) Transcript_36691:147-428(-)